MKKKPQIRCVTYGGRVGWILRKSFSKYTSELYLSFQYMLRKKMYKEYMHFFLEAVQNNRFIQPCLVSIETINRCNGDCAFCPANRNQESRPFAKMDIELFKKIIADLEAMQYSGYLNLYVNNEPFMDVRIEEWYKYAKEHLPKAKMLLYTNGTLVTLERFKKIIPYIDKMIINNYSDNLSLHENIRVLFEYVKSNKDLWDKDISIQIRYNKEILTNRAGQAPNKKEKKIYDRLCIMPFTDITIYPSGLLGLCCSDALEKTNLGNVGTTSLNELWVGEIYSKIRKLMKEGRSKYPFCAKCDFVDAGIRNMFMKEMLRNHDE